MVRGHRVWQVGSGDDARPYDDLFREYWVLLGALSWVMLDGGPVALVVFLAAVCLTPFWLARRGAR